MPAARTERRPAHPCIHALWHWRPHSQAYTDDVTQRLAAVALAFVMTGAPVVTTACEAVCVARESGSATTSERHSCHREALSPEGPAVNGATHLCGHSDEAPNAIDQSLQTLAAPAVIVGTFSLTPPSINASRLRSIRVEHSPPGLLALNTQLRI